MIDEICDLCGEAVPPDELTTCDACGAIYCEDCAEEHDGECREKWGDIDDSLAFCPGCHGEHGPPICPLSPGDAGE